MASNSEVWHYFFLTTKSLHPPYVHVMIHFSSSTDPLLNFLNGGLITLLLLMTHCRPILTFAKSPRRIQSDWMIVWKRKGWLVCVRFHNRWNCIFAINNHNTGIKSRSPPRCLSNPLPNLHCALKYIDPLHKWRLDLNNNTWYILSLILMSQDKGFFSWMRG